MRRSQNTIGKIGTVLSTVSPKAILAAVLLAVMALLWVRVFLRGRSGPASAEAQTALLAEPSAGGPSVNRKETQVRLQPRLLAVEAGRHDRIERDPFVLDRARWFPQEAQRVESVQPETPAACAAPQDALFEKIAKGLVLQAVIRDPSGIPVQACVNGVVLSRGGILKLKENGETYELKVSDIGPEHVQFVCQDRAVTVQMPSSEWLD